MVTINFKLMDIGSIEVDIHKPEPMEKVLQLCDTCSKVDFRAIIAVRNGTIMKGHDLVEDGDIINIFPAISGG
jgi:molybdopterin converting factor small subunit